MEEGFTHVLGIDFNKIYSPIVKHTSFRLVMSIVAHNNMELEKKKKKKDVTILLGDLEEIMYMQQLEGYIDQHNENKVCLLKRSMYGLKQSPRQWYKRFDEYIISCGLSRRNYI